MFQVIKKYGHERGISCAFRQWKAQHSHCQYVHGYALGFDFTFEAETLDERNWVIDFGCLKGLESALKTLFDHKTAVAQDDPMLEHFRELNKKGLIQLVILEKVGCEAFAEKAWQLAQQFLISNNLCERVKITKVTVHEHGSNSASYSPKD